MLTLALAAQAATLSALLDPSTIVAGESANLVLEFQGGQPDAAPTIPEVPGLAIAYRGQSSNVQMLNGRVSSTLKLNYLVSAARTGTYVIPAITASVEGRPVNSAPVTLTVVKADAQTARLAFLSLGLPRREFFVGESTTLALNLFYHPQARPQRAPALHADGVTFITNLQPTELRIQTNGMTYNGLTWLSAVTFVKAGSYEFSADGAMVAVPVRRQAARQDPFDMGFGGLLGGMAEWRELTLATEPLPIQVLPLPEAGRPATFRGAVGDFHLTASLSTNSVSAGDPITLTLRLTGTGALETLTWSAPAEWTGFRSYPASARTETSDPLRLRGTRLIEQVLVPENTTVRQVPPVRFSYFNPTLRQYRTLEHPALGLAVRPAALVAAQPITLAKSDITQPAPARDIVHIKNRIGTLALARAPLLQIPAFLLLQGLPVVLWLAAIAWRRRQDHLAANPQLVRRRQVSRTLHTGLGSLRAHAHAGASREFYAALVRLLQATIGERLNLPASAITGDAVETRLRPAGLDAATCATLDHLFQLCDQAHYAPQQSKADLLALLPQIQDALETVHSFSSKTDSSAPKS